MDKEEKILALLKSKKNIDKAFNLFVDTYQQQLYWHIRRMLQNHDDANDVLQNTFVRIWKALPKFKADAKIYTWAYRIATNESITFLNKKREDTSFDDVAYKMENSLSSHDSFNGDQIQLKLYKAMATLPDKQKAVFALKYFDELQYNEISEIFQTSEGALKASYHLAVKKIEAFLKTELNEF